MNIQILSPFIGITFIGIVSVWKIPDVQGNLRFWLWGLAVGSIITGAIGDYMHYYFKNK